MGAYTIRLFGGFAVELPSGARAPALPQRRAEALLAVLAVYGLLGCSRERLMALLWPESDEAHGRHQLRDALYAIRRAYGSTAVLTEGDIVRLAPATLRSDVQEFAAALAESRPADAVAVYGGAFLDGFHVAGSAELERWIEDERSRLFREYQLAIEVLAKKAESGGRWDAAAQWWGRLLSADPYNSRAAVRRMVALARSGDRANAIREGEAHCRRLKAELELDPDPGLVEELERIRGGALEPSYFSGLSVEAASGSPSDSAPASATPPAPAGAGAPRQAPPPVATAVRATTEPFVSVDGAASAPSAVASPDQRGPAVSAAAVTPANGQLGPHRRSSRRPGLLAVGSLLAVCGAAAGGWLLLRGRQPAANPGRVVVGAFENQTGDAALAPLSNMAADWITQGLAQTGIVELVDAPSALTVAREGRVGTAVRGREAVRLLSRETGAGLVVSGRYYQQADSVAFVAQVVDARTGRVARAVGPVTAPTAAPMQGAERLRQRLMAELAVLLDERLAHFQALERQPPSYDAYREYMDGLARYLGSTVDPTTVDHFERAFALDTTFHRALLWAAECVLMPPPDARLERYDSSLARVERLRARLTPAEQYQLDWLRALRAGDSRAAYAAARLRWEASPGSDDALRELAATAYRVQRFREARALLARLDPNRGLLRFDNLYWELRGLTQHMLGDLAGELRTAAEAARREPEWDQRHRLRLEALAALGRTDEVRSLASRLADRAPSDASQRYVAAARELAAHGKQSDALALARDGLTRCEGAAPTPAQLRPDYRLACAELLGLLGRWHEADALIRRTGPAAGLRFDYLKAAGVAAARLGDRARALALSDSIARMPVQTVGDMYGLPEIEYARAVIAAALGDRDDALRRLRLWHAAGSWGPQSLHSEPALVPYFSDPRFRQLLESED